MNNQEIFDKIVNHLRKQGPASEAGRCVYRSEDGRKSCAAGCLIPDEEYSKEFEGEQLSEDNLVGKYFLNKYPEAFYLIADMQIIHDDDYFDEWEYKFGEVAFKYGLIYNPLSD